jgi:hypothetical protein
MLQSTIIKLKNTFVELYDQPEDITVFGLLVDNFPNAISESFESLMKVFGSDRSYYGISWMDENDCIRYYAMTYEAFHGEAKSYNYKALTITKGQYRMEALYNWATKLDSIRDIFNRLTANIKPDENHPCIEWYKSDSEMYCMVKTL